MSVSPSHPERWIAQHVTGLPRSGIRDFFELVQGVPDVISLGVGEPDFTAPWRAREAAIYALERGRTSYTSNLGLLKLRRAIANFLAKHFQLGYDPEKEILVTVGVSEALDLALRALLDPGDEVIIHQPCFVSYAPSIKLAHAKVVEVVTSPESGFQLDLNALEKAITPKTKAVLINFPCNPTGSTLSSDTARKLAEVIIRNDLLLITDEIYACLVYDQPFVSPASFPGMHERTIYLNGMSKAWAMTGFRLGFVCAPQPLLEAMMRVHQYCMMCASIISQEAAVAALSYCDDDIEQMRQSFHKRRNYLHARFLELGLKCELPQGAFYMFPDIRELGLQSKDFALQLLESQKVAAVPGSAFGSAGEGFLRCCYATSIDELREACDRIGRFLETLR
ncbi:MAG TPA: pyridoxal phosphate-dependent aminotransferase [Verrucomicrobia bacterium]|jgi:aminotransferase|nr:pyridoxal phosphate-dependent aminotransferase [Verrucomicrobiota bacterium]